MSDLLVPAATSYAASMAWGGMGPGSAGPGSAARATSAAGAPGRADRIELGGTAAGTGAAPLDGGCRTCSERRYVDGSDDPGVSFKSPQHVSPSESASAVVSHEREHVRREQAKATDEGRKVLSQTVQIKTSLCPECGRSYVSGGLTTTVTAPEAPSPDARGPGALLDRTG